MALARVGHNFTRTSRPGVPVKPTRIRTLAPNRPVAVRARYARTSGNMLIGGYDGPGINPSDQPPIWWWGLDSGGGAYPIGPNGPWPYGTAEALPVVIRATALITGPLTAATFRVVDLRDGHPLGRARWLTDPMLLRPDNRFPTPVFRTPRALQLPRSEFWTNWIRSAVWWGVGAFLAEHDETGQPIPGSMRLLNPHALTTERDANNVPVWVVGDYDGEGVAFDADGTLTLGGTTYHITVLRNPHSPVDDDGMSRGVFELAPEAFQLAGQVDSYASGTFRAGIPAGYLKVTTPGLNQSQADDLKAKWMESHGGDRKSIAVLNATTEFMPLNLSPVDAALAEVKRLSIADVAFAFGLDPMTLGAGLNNSATYTNLRDAWQNHRDFGLAPYQAAVQDTLSALLPDAQAVLVNLDGFANPPASERVATGAAAVDAGLMTKEEWRELEGLPPLPPGATESEEQARALSAPEAVQKVYLGVTNGVISVPEARQMVNDAGGNLDVDAVPGATEPAPEPEPEPEPERAATVPVALRKRGAP